MAKKDTSDKALMDALEEIITLTVENQVKLEALEQVLLNTNPLMHELYIGELEKLREQRSVQSNRGLIATLKEKLREG